MTIPVDKKSLPWLSEQNPAPVDMSTFDDRPEVLTLVSTIMQVFYQLLPSNYVSQVRGPYYTLQFQAVAKEIAKLQKQALEVLADSDLDYTRPEFIHQIIGCLVFPDPQSDLPQIPGDISYRLFLKRMVALILQGSKQTTVQEGLDLLGSLTDDGTLTFDVNDLDALHAFEVFISKFNKFPEDPEQTRKNVELVLQALKPAHTIYSYRHLFTEFFGTLFTDESRWVMESSYYEDFRRYGTGAQSLVSTGVCSGTHLTDTSVDFTNVQIGSILTISSGPNKGVYRVVGKSRNLPATNVSRTYTTSPSFLVGSAIVEEEGVLYDSSQDWGSAVDGETLTFLDGTSYRLETIVGVGPIGSGFGSGTRVRVAVSTLEVYPPFRQAVASTYSVTVDRLGRTVPYYIEDEDVSEYFLPNNSDVFDTLYTSRGPLVKNWGDGTPATIQDVVVKVNGFPVTLKSVNPYLGQVVLDTAISNQTVTVTYYWQQTPLMSMSGLNIIGAGPNLFASTRGLLGGFSDYREGAAHSERFPMQMVIGPLGERPSPQLVGHQFMGLEAGYSSVSNSPSLISNQSTTSIPFMEDPTESVAVAYNGGAPSWDLLGSDQGTHTDIDLTIQAQGVAAYYKKQISINESSCYMATRFYVSQTAYDGVFSGVGFGLHDNQNLWLVGLLRINGVKHLGLLKDSAKPSLAASWSVGPSISGTVTSSTTCVLYSYPTGTKVGDKFQIFSGNQAGVYTISAFDKYTKTVTVSNPFPADPVLIGGKYVSIVFEVDWSQMTTYRMSVSDSTLIEYSGTRQYTLTSFDGVSALPSPANSTLCIPTWDASDDIAGRMFFFGSVSSNSSTSTWTFTRYGIVPLVSRSKVITESAFFDSLPDGDEGWSQVGLGGSAKISSNTLQIVSNPYVATDALLTLGYAQFEYGLGQGAFLDYRGKVQVPYGTGTLDMLMGFSDGARCAYLTNVSYVENGGARSLVSLPSLTFDSSWSKTGSATSIFQDHSTKISGSNSYFTNSLPAYAYDSGGRVVEFRSKIISGTPILDVAFSGLVGGVRIYWGSGSVVLKDLAGVTVQSYAFNWQDGKFHSYRLVVDASGASVTLSIDDSVQVPTANTASFGVAAGVGISLGFSAATSLEVEYLTVVALPDVSVKRTLGVLLKSNPSTINDFELPRTDSSTAKNSSLSAIVQQMDFTSDCDLRLLFDPLWGICVLRPDLPMPPYYMVGEFATQKIQPSAGWVNVEYDAMPSSSGKIPHVVFGSKNISTQVWSPIQYKVTRMLADNPLPQNIGLNIYNVASSIPQDRSPETVEVVSKDLRSISLLSVGIYAQSVYKIVSGNTIYTYLDWNFDPITQTVLLNGDVSDFPSESCTVVYIASRSNTSIYLTSQKLEDIDLKLNEGTPTVTESLSAETTTYIVQGTSLDWPNPTLVTDEDYVLKDSVRYRNLEDTARFVTLDHYVTSEGDTGLIYYPFEATEISSGFSGFSQTEDMAVGGHVLAFTGFSEYVPEPQNSDLPYLYAGGGAISYKGLVNYSQLLPNADTLNVMMVLNDGITQTEIVF